MNRDFSCVYAVSKMKAQLLLDTPQVKSAGISAFRFMDDILGSSHRSQIISLEKIIRKDDNLSSQLQFQT